MLSGIAKILTFAQLFASGFSQVVLSYTSRQCDRKFTTPSRRSLQNCCILSTTAKNLALLKLLMFFLESPNSSSPKMFVLNFFFFFELSTIANFFYEVSFRKLWHGAN